MIPPTTVERLKRAILSGYSDYHAAEIAGCHRNTALMYRRVFERAGIVPPMTIRRDRRGRKFDATAIGNHNKQERMTHDTKNDQRGRNRRRGTNFGRRPIDSRRGEQPIEAVARENVDRYTR